MMRSLFRGRRTCAIDHAALAVLTAAMKTLTLGARGHDRVRKVARTMADLPRDNDVRRDHVAEALQFRMR